jgi:hypothetical protein
MLGKWVLGKCSPSRRLVLIGIRRLRAQALHERLAVLPILQLAKPFPIRQRESVYASIAGGYHLQFRPSPLRRRADTPTRPTELLQLLSRCFNQARDGACFEFVHQTVAGERNNQVGPFPREKHFSIGVDQDLVTALEFNNERAKRLPLHFGFKQIQIVHFIKIAVSRYYVQANSGDIGWSKAPKLRSVCLTIANIIHTVFSIPQANRQSTLQFL